MAMPRFDGSTSLTTTSSILSSPAVISSSPAIIRSKVDFPQPEGPTKTTNSPDLISRSTPLTTSSEPKALRILRSVSSLIACRSPPSYRCQVQRFARKARRRHFDGHRSRQAGRFQPEAGRPALEGDRLRPDQLRGSENLHRHHVVE